MTKPFRPRGGGDLQERVRAALQARFKPLSMQPGSGPKDEALLLDTTGSMRGGAIRELREFARSFLGYRRFEYADDIHELGTGDEIRDASGGNNEPLARQTMKNLGIKHIVLITNGGADDPPAALRAAVGLKIDVIYIGPPPPPQFLRDLAAATGGSYGKATLSARAALEIHVRGLLAPPSPLAGQTGKGPIIL